MDPRSAPRSFLVQNEIEAVHIRFITGVKQGQIEITSVAFVSFLEPGKGDKWSTPVHSSQISGAAALCAPFVGSAFGDNRSMKVAIIKERRAFERRADKRRAQCRGS